MIAGSGPRVLAHKSTAAARILMTSVPISNSITAATASTRQIGQFETAALNRELIADIVIILFALYVVPLGQP